MKIEPVEISKINPAPYNPRKDLKPGDPEYEKLKKSISKFDIVEPLVWNVRTGNLVGGHQRLKILQERGDHTIDVSVVDLDDTDEKALNLALNKISGDWDEGKLSELLGELSALPDFDIELTGFDADELASLNPTEIVEDDFDVDKAVDEIDEPTTKYGDIIQLGRHRLMCGDSIKTEDVTKLLNNKIPFIMVTDPPYGVNYDPSWRRRLDPRSKYREGKVENDNIVDWSAVYQTFEGDVIYVWHAGTHAGEVASNLFNADFNIRAQIIWVKQSIVMGRGAYHWKHEPCWYAVRNGRKAKWVADRKQSTVWELPNVHRTQGTTDDQVTNHGTQKPIECMLRPIQHHGTKEDIVYDPFVGSGTTLIAAEQLGRVCYAMEISPVYCDVIITRWEDFTGKKAVRL